MAEAPLPAWDLCCPWCDFALKVFARGGRGKDQGAGVEAANRMQTHIARDHPERTWREFLAATDA